MKIIIVGAGEVGYHFAEWLAQKKKEVVVIDIDPEALMRVSDHLDVHILQGSGANPRVLEESGLKTADIILAVTDVDPLPGHALGPPGNLYGDHLVRAQVL